MNFNMNQLGAVLDIIVNNPNILDKIDCMPNAPMKTMGGDIWWNDLKELNGWRIQKNMVFQ